MRTAEQMSCLIDPMPKPRYAAGEHLDIFERLK
jgi:hypothetical protein